SSSDRFEATMLHRYALAAGGALLLALGVVAAKLARRAPPNETAGAALVSPRDGGAPAPRPADGFGGFVGGRSSPADAKVSSATPLVQSEGIFVGSDAHKFFGLTKEGTIRFRLDADGDVDTGAAPAPWGGIVFAAGRVVYASKPDGTLLWRVQARKKCYSSPA